MLILARGKDRATQILTYQGSPCLQGYSHTSLDDGFKTKAFLYAITDG